MFKRLTRPQKHILIGTPIIFIFAFIIHFIFEWTNANKVIGLFAPVNESVWEHTKLAILPTIIWWGMYYYFNNRKENINKNSWFTASLGSVITSIIISPFVFYFYTGAFGVESVVIDIIILFISVLLGQLLGLYLYNHGKCLNSKILAIIFVIIFTIYATFTFYPPKLPLFVNQTDNTYGINKDT